MSISVSKKRLEKLKLELIEKQKDYNEKFKDVKGFKQRFFRTAGKKIVQKIEALEAKIKTLEKEKRELERAKKRSDSFRKKIKRYERKTIYEGDLFGVLRGGKMSPVLKIVNRMQSGLNFSWSMNTSIDGNDKEKKGYNLQSLVFAFSELSEMAFDSENYLVFELSAIIEYIKDEKNFYLISTITD